MRAHWLVAFTLGALVGVAHEVPAQTNAAEWHKGTALAVFGGAASASGGTGGAMGAAIGWELTPYFTLEGSGAWTTGDVDAFTALIGSRVHLLSRRTVVPFVSVGVGMQRASIDTRGAIPSFYSRRMGDGTRAPLQVERIFEDFVVAAGGGFDLYLRRHLSLRPDVRVLFVRAGARTRPVAVYGVHVAYHFEEHPITP